MDCHGLIFDLGVSEGNDTAFYLAKGFKVVAVEADPAMVRHLRARFSTEIGTGAVKLLPFAAADSFGAVLDFHAHAQHQGVSGLSLNPDLSPDGYHPPQQVITIDWATLLAQGVPRYVKIDMRTTRHRSSSGWRERASSRNSYPSSVMPSTPSGSFSRWVIDASA